MKREKITEMFDTMANTYDDQWEKLSGINNALHLQITGIFAKLNTTSNLLCVGAGTGSEIIHLGQIFTKWRFTVVEPSTQMLDVCKRKLRETGIKDRCTFHCGYLESLETEEKFDGATAILVSQFITEKHERQAFFNLISSFLKTKGLFVNVDLSADQNMSSYEQLLSSWVLMMNCAGIQSANLKKMTAMYDNDIAMLPEKEISELIASSGFANAIHFFQSILIHGWYFEKP